MQGSGLILIIGGNRSGKSRFAQRLLADHPQVTYVATGANTDPEMAARIARHRAERPAHWQTVEVTRRLGAAIAGLPAGAAVLLDDLGFLVADVLWRGGYESSDPALLDRLEAELTAEVDALAAAAALRTQPVVVVSSEVGSGLVPTTPLGRAFQDLIGRANQWLAAAAPQVFLCVAGIPVELKALAYRRESGG